MIDTMHHRGVRTRTWGERVRRSFRWVMRPGRRLTGLLFRARIISGCVLFAFVTTHLLNHSLGNISVDAMEGGVQVFELMWRNPLGLVALYLSLIVHAGLGFVALYQRRSFRYGYKEVPQLVIGLLIPFVLLMHIVAVRAAYVLHGTHKTYAQELFQFWVTSPVLGALQVALLIAVWCHGCIGLYFWLRLQRFFPPPLRAIALGLAVAIPLLALLGFYQGGRIIRHNAADPAWRAIHATPIELGTSEERAQLLRIRWIALASYGSLLLLVLGARLLRSYWERSGKIVTVKYPGGMTVRVPLGLSILDASVLYSIPLAAVCGGKARCGTCRCLVIEGESNLPLPGPAEARMLQKLGLEDRRNIRLACQTRPVGDVSVVPIVPFKDEFSFTLGRRGLQPGRTRKLAVLYVELRQLAAASGRRTHLDPIFIANQFVDAVTEAVKASGGICNRIYGFGLLALFGVDCDESTAARQALEASAMIGVNVDHVNSVLAAALPAPLAFSAGVDSGLVTLGDANVEGSLVLTAIGDVVRNAMGLTELAIRSRKDVIASETLCEAAGLPSTALSREKLMVWGHEVVLRVAEHSSSVFGALDSLIDVRAHTIELDTITLAGEQPGLRT